MKPVIATLRTGTELKTVSRKGLDRVALPDANGKLPAEEHALVTASQRGERQAFAQLVERYWERLYRWLFHLTRDRHAAEDLAQETFLKAFRGLKRFRAGSNFKAWLFCIGHNTFANHRRANARIRLALPDDVAQQGQSPIDQVVSREVVQLLAKAVSKLPPDFRSAFLLRVEEDLSFREIADVLGLTEETARWRVFKARQKLLKLLAPQCEEITEFRDAKSQTKSKEL